MKKYPIPMVPGPVSVPPTVRDAYGYDYGASDLEPEFLELYNRCETNLKQVMATANTVVIQTGEGMLALWSALKSCLAPGDPVVSIGTGVFGDGIGDMAARVGARVRKISLPYNETISDLTEIRKAIKETAPKMITAVHCETPSGTLNPLAELGRLKAEMKVPLFYVDAVSSIGGAPVLTDEWQIDLGLGGSQKCLSSLPDMAFLSISERAWEIIDAIDYAGYDALKPFRTAQENFYFPYTPSWHGIAGLCAGAERILEEGLENCFRRHEEIAAHCRTALTDLGFSLFPAPGAVPSPTVTAVNLPDGVSWETFDAGLRKRGLVVGGSYGPMAGKVFRLGHMGSQADMGLLDGALRTLKEVAEKS
jgi:aspartate aminotransferase-like enzyme